MKTLKIPGLAALATAALMAFAGSASADYVTTTTGGPAATPTIHAVNEGHSVFENAHWSIPCSSTIEGNVTSHGAGNVVSGKISHLTFTGCTNSWHVTTIATGSFSIEATSDHGGTLSSDGARIEATRFGIKCVLETADTHLDRITGGNPATLDIVAFILIDESASSGLCGTAFAWFADYATTSALYVVNS